MRKGRRALIIAATFACVAPLAFAQTKLSDEPPQLDPSRPAIGEWIGGVSWNAPIVTYAWTIYPDGAFSSGRAGRGQNGAGEWGVFGDHLTLKYDDGFRYEGELHDDAYHGTAYRADGTVFGGFSMYRATKPSEPDEADGG